MSTPRRYRSYLLRLWQATDDEEAPWRASLENPQTGERLGFGTLERLFAFLNDQTSVETEGPQTRSGAIE